MRNISTAKAVGTSEIKMDGSGLIVSRSIGSNRDNSEWLVDFKTYDKDYNVKYTLAAVEIPNPFPGG